MNLTRSFFALRQGGKSLSLLNGSKSSVSLNLLKAFRPTVASNQRYFSLTPIIKTEQKEDGALVKLFRKIPFLKLDSLKMKASGYLLYENTVDDLNYIDFFEKFDIPDTFYSWFVITELHIWMLSVRAMAEGNDGQILRNGIIEALWADVTQRTKKIGSINPSESKKQLQELSEQFQAALIAYDEAVNSDDIVLAGALWRRLYQRNYASPQHLEALIHYVRKHVKYLDNLSKEQLIKVKSIIWEPI